MLHLSKFYEILRSKGFNTAKSGNISLEISRLLMDQGITKPEDIAKVADALKEANTTQVVIAREKLMKSHFNTCNV